MNLWPHVRHVLQQTACALVTAGDSARFIGEHDELARELLTVRPDTIEPRRLRIALERTQLPRSSESISEALHLLAELEMVEEFLDAFGGLVAMTMERSAEAAE